MAAVSVAGQIQIVSSAICFFDTQRFMINKDIQRRFCGSHDGLVAAVQIVIHAGQRNIFPDGKLFVSKETNREKASASSCISLKK